MATPSSGGSSWLTAPLRAAGFLARGDARLADLGDGLRRLKKAIEDLRDLTRTLGRQASRVDERFDALEREVRTLRSQVEGQILRNTLQLGRLARRVGSAEAPADVRLGGPSLPLSIDDAPAPDWAAIEGGHPDPEGREWMDLTACPGCGHPEGTVVLEWNKLVMLTQAPDPASIRYDYTLCHACGVVFAARRPVGRRFLYLLEHFGEVTGKRGGAHVIPNPMLNPYPLTEEDEAKLRRMAAHGAFVSDHLGLPKTEYLRGVLKDRFENSVHVDLIGSLVAPHGARVLEIRPRAGTIAESLRRLYKADVSVMPMWQSQKLLLKELYGFDSDGVIDYDHFTVPYDGPFDLVVCNHMLTHMLRPAECLAELRRHLKVGGYLYLYNEPDDREFLDGGQSIIAHLNPLHVQVFDQQALIRFLAASGFEVTFLTARDSNHLCLARAVEGPVAWTPLTAAQVEARVGRYRRARDRGIVKLPEAVRGRLAGEWNGAVERGLAAGDLDFDEKGHLKFVAR